MFAHIQELSLRGGGRLFGICIRVAVVNSEYNIMNEIQQFLSFCVCLSPGKSSANISSTRIPSDLIQIFPCQRVVLGGIGVRLQFYISYMGAFHGKMSFMSSAFVCFPLFNYIPSPSRCLCSTHMRSIW